MEYLAVKGNYLASGAHAEVAIWCLSSDSKCSYHPVPSTPYIIDLLGEWWHLLDLGPPPKNSYNENREVLVTSVHWTMSKSRNPLLLVTYLHHGYV